MIDARDEFRQRYLDPDQLKMLSERHSRPSQLVNKVVDARGEAGTALDLGCGCGKAFGLCFRRAGLLLAG